MRLRLIEEELVEEARSRTDRHEYRGSITHGVGNFAGRLGESMVRQWMILHDAPVEFADDPEFDLVSKGGRRVEVKTQRTTSDSVQPGYGAIIESRIHRGIPYLQEADAFVFVRVNESTLHGLIVGWALPEDILDWRFCRVGEVVEGLAVKRECRRTDVCALRPMATLIETTRRLDPTKRKKYHLNPF